MTRRERPAAVTRHLSSLLWLPAAAAALFGWYFFTEDLPAHRPARLDSGNEVAVEGVVQRPKPGDSLKVQYLNPVTEQQVTADVYVWHEHLVPHPGSKVRLIVSRADPLDVAVEGDAMPLYTNLVPYAVGLIALSLPVLMRLHAQRRTERLMAAPAASFSMAGILTPHRWRRFRCDLSLYPLDAAPGAPPVCTVPVLTTGGVRLQSQVFAAEVKGSPRPLGRVVARAGDAVLWPAGRAGRRAAHRRPAGPMRIAPPLVHASGEERARPPGWLAALHWEALIFGVSVVVLVIVIAVTVVHGTRADEVQAGGAPVVGEVVDHDADDFVVLRYHRAGTDHLTRAPAYYASDYRKGVRYPVRLDPDNPSRSRLLAEPYNRVEPIAWATLPAAGMSAIAWRRWRSWRRNRSVATNGPWWQAWVRRGPEEEDLVVGDSNGDVLCGVIASGNTYRSTEWLPVIVAGSMEPGAPVAVWRAGGAAMNVVALATNGGAPWLRSRPWARRS